MFSSLNKKKIKKPGVLLKYIRKSKRNPFPAKNNQIPFTKPKKNFHDDQEFYSLSEIDDEKIESHLKIKNFIDYNRIISYS